VYGITFSALPRAFACRLSTVLPRVDHESDDAREGTVRHAFFQRVTELLQPVDDAKAGRPAYPLEDARELALAEAPEEYRAGLSAIPLETLGLGDVAAEVAVAFDVATGEARELGRGIGREYAKAAEAQGHPIRETEVVGTIDRLGFIGSAGLHVGDYKGRSHTRRPSQDAQLLAGALAASRIYGRHQVELEIVRVIDGEGYSKKEHVDILEVDSFETRLAELRARITRDRAAFAAGDVPEAEVSSHCRYCPSMRYCPAQMAIARAVLGGDSDEINAIVKVGQAYITPETAPRLHALVAQGEKVLEIVKDALREFARATPFPLGDGRWYGVPPESKEREIVDGPAAARVLTELFGADAAKAGTKVEVTLTGVEAAVKAYLAAHPERAKRGAIKEGKECAEQLLSERGLLRISYGGKVKIHKREEVARG
jgi:RecB family exonuclease